MSQVSIPISMRGGFKSLEAAKAHREVLSKAQGLRSEADRIASELKGIDRADIDSTPSDEGIDLAAGTGHVIVVGDNDDGSVAALELRYNPDSGLVRSFKADTPEGKLTQSGELAGSTTSPTYKWEENGSNGQSQVTYFKFDDQRNVLAILDPQSDSPRVIANGDQRITNELAQGTLQGGIPIIQF